MYIYTYIGFISICIAKPTTNGITTESQTTKAFMYKILFVKAPTVLFNYTRMFFIGFIPYTSIYKIALRKCTRETSLRCLPTFALGFFHCLITTRK